MPTWTQYFFTLWLAVMIACLLFGTITISKSFYLLNEQRATIARAFDALSEHRQYIARRDAEWSKHIEDWNRTIEADGKVMRENLQTCQYNAKLLENLQSKIAAVSDFMRRSAK